jgi:hypothetical protein
MRCRREHLLGVLVLAWHGSARAEAEDVVVERASRDLHCDELRMTHAGNQYAVAGCGRVRRYECANGTCDDVTNRKTGADPNAQCVAQAIRVTAIVGCACLGAMASKSPPAPDFIPPNALDACK